MKERFENIKRWLKGLSYRTGVIVAGICALCYVISFAQMLLPISVAAKSVLWFVFYGLAKTCQYAALLILGKAGLKSLQNLIKR